MVKAEFLKQIFSRGSRAKPKQIKKNPTAPLPTNLKIEFDHLMKV